jgi:5-methylcytosine-specific restriction endonuclease McrA
MRPRKWDPVLPSKPDPTLKRNRSGSWYRLREQLRLSQGIFRCRDCRIVSDRLEAHHIVPISVDPSRELDPTNVVFLCQHCHKLRHSRKLDPPHSPGGIPAERYRYVPSPSPPPAE